MLTPDDLKQLRSVIREENEPLNAKIDGLESRLDGVVSRIDGVESRLNAKIDGVELRLTAKLDKSEEEFGGLLHEIVDIVSDRHTKLEHRIDRIETHLDLPKPH